jgi:hypothetical protein
MKSGPVAKPKLRNWDLVLVLVLGGTTGPCSTPVRKIKDRVRERRRGGGRLGRELGPRIAGIVCIKAIDQSGLHCYNTREHFLTGLNTIHRDQSLSDRRIEASGALECRATGVIEEIGALAPLTLTVALVRIEKYGETRTVKLFN